MKNQYSLWQHCLKKLRMYSLLAICTIGMEKSLLARGKRSVFAVSNTITQKQNAAGIMSDQQQAQSLCFNHLFSANNSAYLIKLINDAEDEELRRRARQAEEDAEAARQAAEDARRESYYYDDPYYDDGPWLGFGFGGGGWHHHGHHHGGHHGGGHGGGHGHR